MAPPGFFVFLFSAQSLLRNFTEAPTGSVISMSDSEVCQKEIEKLRAAGAVSRYAQ